MGAVLFSQASFALYFDAGLGSATAENDEFDLDGSDTYFKLAIGGELSDALAVEGGYLDLGEAEDGPVSGSADGFFGNVKGSHAINSDTRIFGKIGLFIWDSEVCLAGVGCLSDDGNDLFYGGGVGFDIGPGQLNLELLLMSLDDVDVTTIGGSYSIPFGN
jgi:hypothetical protein